MRAKINKNRNWRTNSIFCKRLTRIYRIIERKEKEKEKKSHYTQLHFRYVHAHHQQEEDDMPL
jgi:hypothetical protein